MVETIASLVVLNSLLLGIASPERSDVSARALAWLRASSSDAAEMIVPTGLVLKWQVVETENFTADELDRMKSDSERTKDPVLINTLATAMALKDGLKVEWSESISFLGEREWKYT